MRSDGMADVLPSLSCADPTLSSRSELEDHSIELQPAPLLFQNDAGDDILLAAAANGSKSALGLLFRRYRHAVTNVALRILKDAAEAEDLCQDVFLFLFQKAKQFDASKGTASSWIIQIAYHRAINRRHYLTFRQHYNAEQLNEEQTSAKREPLFIDEIAARALLDRVREQLSADQRHTLELHFFEGYSFREIAEKTNQTLGNIRHHYYRGLECLRSNVFPEKDA
jgi:RNA polymerase sigma-70 factor, ECF subfamily